MNISVGDRVIMKKQHPCGSSEFTVLRVGLDFRLKCVKCGREVLTPRIKILKSIKRVCKEGQNA